MSDTKRVGIDLAKKIYHLTAVDESGAVVERKRLRRARQLAVKDRTAHANPLHGFLLEYGIESRIGDRGIASASGGGSGRRGE